jgi:serine/threonine-protein kinase
VDEDATGRLASEDLALEAEEARAFLQKRLALLGKIYGLIGLSFYLAAMLVLLRLPGRSWPEIEGRGAWVILAANAIYLLQWLLCRRGRLSERVLRIIDGTSVTLVAFLISLKIFDAYPGEVPGLSYARTLLLVTYGLVLRAVFVPSSARRTLLLGLVAASFPVATSYVWYSSQRASVPPVPQAMWTALWCFSSVVISALASRVIFGLRQQVREAWRLGQYTLLEKIGEGGMGAVFRARHAMLRRPTAVKLLPPGKGGAEQLMRFEREVQLTSRLSHPNTVVIFDYGRTPGGVFYYAMEYLAGADLEKLVRRHGPQPPGRVVHILRQVAGSLSEAHAIGLIHRDVKPANIILVAERGGAADVAKVVDFGLVRDLDETAELTKDDVVRGTPHYLSPEAIRAPETVDARSDLYALGAVGYLLLTGRLVFEGGTVMEVCGHHLHTKPVAPAERLGRPLPATLSRLTLDCLEKDPDHRPESAEDFLKRLARCDDVAPWTESEARRWWKEHGDSLVSGEAQASVPGSTPIRTLSVLRRAEAP